MTPPPPASPRATDGDREAARLAIERRARATRDLGHVRRRTEALREQAERLEGGASVARRALGAAVGSRPWAVGVAIVRALAGDGGSRAGPRSGDALHRRLRRDRRDLHRLARRVRAYEQGPAAETARIAAAVRRRRSSAEPVRRMSPTAKPVADGIAIEVPARDPDAAERGGDVHLARALAAALARRGHRAVLGSVAGGVPDGAPAPAIRVVVRGRAPARLRTDQLNLLWLISHPSEVPLEEIESYDGVLVASESHAATLAARVRVPVAPMLQFADADVFSAPAAAAADAETHDLLFAGNWRGVYRRAVWDAHCAGLRPTLVGDGWRHIAPQDLLATHVPYRDLPRLYRSARVLLVDHWDDMRAAGYPSNRVFDALACGAFVVCDAVDGLSRLLPGGLLTYRTPDDLAETVARALRSPDWRERVARRGRELVASAHTADDRVDDLLATAVLAARAASRPLPEAAATLTPPPSSAGVREP